MRLLNGYGITSCSSREDEKAGGNRFGKTSRLVLKSEADQKGRSYLSCVEFSAPFKVMSPFTDENGIMEVMYMAASAGIMEGDRQEFEVSVQKGSGMLVTSQSYDKIHRMPSGHAERQTVINVADNAFLLYMPQTVIPFAGSEFCSSTDIELAGMKSTLIYQEIMSCGRASRGEKFQYRKFSSGISVKREGRLIYRENVKYVPDDMPMSGAGMFEGFTHMASMLIFGAELTDALENDIKKLICAETMPGEQKRTDAENDMVSGGMTHTAYGDTVIRIFGYRAQRLEEICGLIERFVLLPFII